MNRVRALVFAAGMFASGAAFADFWDGMDAYNAGKFTEALSEFQPLADRGKAEAQLIPKAGCGDSWGIPFPTWF